MFLEKIHGQARLAWMKNISTNGPGDEKMSEKQALGISGDKSAICYRKNEN